MSVSSPGIVFMGTPTFAQASLQALVESGRNIRLVVTQPDRPAGRGQRPTLSPVKAYAEAQGLPIFQPKRMRSPETLARLRDIQADLHIVVAYGRLLPQSILDLPKLTLNVHASLLPRWRGASPISRAIVAGDAHTGVSIMKLVEALDAGDVALQESLEIDPQETMGDLTARLAHLGAQTLLKAVSLFEVQRLQFAPQDTTKVTFAPPVAVDEARIPWSKSAWEVHNHIRGFHPWPGAFTYFKEERLKIHQSYWSPQQPDTSVAPSPGALLVLGKTLWVGCQDRWLNIRRLQRQNRSAQSSEQFVLGFRFSPGDRVV